jgi:hypothetical protein
MKHAVTLHFPSVQNLYAFLKEGGTNNFEVSLRARLLTLSCTEEQLELATTKYQAKVASLQQKSKT